jgi:hypothetical protein
MYSIHLSTDVIERNRKKPRLTSTNAQNIRKIFNIQIRRVLFIPLTINAYNHHMNGTDIINQFRKFLTTQRKHNQRTWKSLFY